MNDLIIEDWVLTKEYMPKNVWHHDKGITGGYIQDDEQGQRCYRVVGTAAQIKAWDSEQNLPMDEVYKYEPIEKGSYWDGIVCGERADRPTRKEYNDKYKADLERYSKMYAANNNKILVLRTA